MKKKLVALLLVLTMVVCILPMSAFADNMEVGTIPNLTGVLTTDDGTTYFIKGEFVDTPQAYSNNESSSTTIKYELPAATPQSGSNTVSGNDGGLSSTVYLTISYKVKSDENEYLLTGVSGYWVITDSKASVESATLNYGCTGGGVTQAVNDLSVSNWFNISTGFQNYVPAYGIFSVMGANLTVNYLMGTARRWSFTLPNLLFNN